MKAQLDKNLKVLHLLDADSHAANTYNTPVIDVKDFDEILLILNMGEMQASSTVTVTVPYDSASDGSFANSVTGATMTLLASSHNDQTFIGRLDVRELPERFIRPKVVVAVDASEFSLCALLGSPEKAPVTQEDGTGASPENFAKTTVSFSIGVE